MNFLGLIIAIATNATDVTQVDGKVGKTEAGAVAVTADNYFSFVGQANANNTTINTTNIAFTTE